MADFKYIPADAYKLEALLRSAIEEDEKYMRENAAKFRAVEQGKNYEEFRDIVKAAHLKPLEKHDSFRPGKMGSATWNSAAKRGNKVPKYNILSPAITDMPEMPLEDIVVDDLTHRNFERCWISSENPEMRMQLLQRLISTEDVFKGRELSPDLIGSILKTILELFEPNSCLLKCDESIDFIFKVMKVISSTSRSLLVRNQFLYQVTKSLLTVRQYGYAIRFSLNLQFLNDDGKNILKTLMKKVTELLEKKANHMNSNDQVLRQILDKFIC